MTRLSSLFLPTLREDPADAEAVSHRLMVRAGLIRQLGAGLWTWLPAGYRVIERVEAIIREEMDAIGGQEMLMPVLQPAELWRRTGRYEIDELFKLEDRKGSEHVLAMTHEEALTFHVAARDPLLPRAAEDPLPPADQGARRAAAARRRPAHPRVHDEGRLLLRPRRGGPRRELRAHTGAPTTRIFDRCGLRWYEVESDVGMMGGSGAHEYMAPCAAGENEVALAPGYAANVEVASAAGAAGRAAAGARRAARGADPGPDHGRRGRRGARGSRRARR